MKTLTILEYAHKIGVAPTTVYRRIERGELQAVTEDGVKKVVAPDDAPAIQDALQSEYGDELKRQIERLEQQNAELLRELQESRERSDTIILQLTQQVESLTNQNQLHLRPTRRWYHRLLARGNA